MDENLKELYDTFDIPSEDEDSGTPAGDEEVADEPGIETEEAGEVGDKGSQEEEGEASSEKEAEEGSKSERSGGEEQDVDSSADETSPDETSDEVSLEDLRAQNKSLIEQINKLSGGSQQDQEPAAPKPASAQAPAQEPASQEINFLEGESFDDIVETPQAFNKFMNKVYQMALNKAGEGVLRSIPTIINRQVDMQQGLRSAVTEFYETHKELQTVKPFVAQTANAVAAENPDWSVGQVFEETAKRARQALGLKPSAVAPGVKKPVQNPAFPSRPGSRSGGAKQKISDLEKDIAETFDIDL